MRVALDRHESALLRDVAEQTRALFEEQDDSDPVIQRVFPDAYESQEEARAFKELTESELRSSKVAALESLIEALDRSNSIKLTLTSDEVEAWLTALTDMRLALGTRIDVTEEMMNKDVDSEDPDAGTLYLLHWLGWVQESMLEAMTQTQSRRRFM